MLLFIILFPIVKSKTPF